MVRRITNGLIKFIQVFNHIILLLFYPVTVIRYQFINFSFFVIKIIIDSCNSSIVRGKPRYTLSVTDVVPNCSSGIA